MKQTANPRRLALLFAGAGCLGLLLRAALYVIGMDEKGLLPRWHWTEIALWLVTIAATAAAVYLTRSIRGSCRYRDCFPISLPAAIGAVVAAVAVLLSSLPLLRGGNAERFHALLGIAAAMSLLVTAYCRLCGGRPFFLFHAVVCLYFALTMVLQYRTWSSDPQLMDYCFSLCAYALLTLAAYHRAAFDAGMGSHRALWLTSLLAVYLCFTAVYAADDALRLLAAALWALTNLSAPGEARRRRPSMDLQMERPADETT